MRLVTPTFLLFAFLAFPSFSVAAPSDPIKLWPGVAPGDEDVALKAQDTEVRKDQTQITRNVSVPTLTMYLAPEDNNKGTTILVCPGGAYNVLANSHEGIDVCEFLNSQGINAGLLMYRVPRRPDRDKHAAPLQDVQRAMTMIRANAKEWKLRPEKVGILGFSAGGHLSAMALTSDGKRTYPSTAAGEEPEGISCVPDFGVLVYPAYLEAKDETANLSPELTVTATTPPTFLVVADDDKKYVEGSAWFYIQMFRKNRPCELHIFAKGGHGFGMRKTDERVAHWPQMAVDWMGASGFVK